MRKLFILCLPLIPIFCLPAIAACDDKDNQNKLIVACYRGVEYIRPSCCRTTSLTLAVDLDGRPRACTNPAQSAE